MIEMRGRKRMDLLIEFACDPYTNGYDESIIKAEKLIYLCHITGLVRSTHDSRAEGESRWIHGMRGELDGIRGEVGARE